MINDFELFTAVVKAGSMAAAGRALGLSAAAVSTRVTVIEERLGVRLLHRTTRKMTLTEVGRQFHDRALVVLEAIDAAESVAAGQAAAVRGHVRVSAPTSFGRLHIAPHLGRFLALHPRVSLEVNLDDRLVDIVGEGVDLAIRIAALPDSTLIARKLAGNRRVLCASPAYLARHSAPAGLRDLDHHTLLAASSQSQWRLQTPRGVHSLQVKSAIQTNSNEVIREAALAGVGIALRSTWDIGPALRSGALQIVLPEYQSAEDVNIYAVYPNRKLVSAAVTRLIEFLADTYGAPGYWSS